MKLLLDAQRRDHIATGFFMNLASGVPSEAFLIDPGKIVGSFACTLWRVQFWSSWTSDFAGC